MTRLEQLKLAEAKDAERLEARRQKVIAAEAKQLRKNEIADAKKREEERKAFNRRCYQVGAMAAEAGLFAWSDTDLAAVMVELARLREATHPAAVLGAMLADVDALADLESSL